MAVANKTLTLEEQTGGAAVQTEPTAIAPFLGQTTTAIEPEIPTSPGKTIVSQTEVVQSGVVRPTELSLGGPNYYETQAPLVSTWESNAEKQAGAQFQKDVLAAKQSLVQNRQQMQQQGEQAQTQLALGDYMRSQSAEKAGWTGGYMLDQKRQGDYLRASIQAQMYGAQELQRYGMETQLEAARLAFDLGKEQLAYQLYQQEQQKAITEAQMFGYYVSPEIKDLINQLRTAQSVLVDDTASTNEKTRAQSVIDQIDTWFGEEGVDPNDVTTFSEITMEREQWNQAKLDAILATINDDPSMFLQRNATGGYSIDPATGQYIKLDFDNLNSDDLITYLNSDNDNPNPYADNGFKSYLRYLGQETLFNYFATLNEDQQPSQDGFAAYLLTEGNNKVGSYLASIGLSEEQISMLQAQIGESITASYSAGNKSLTGIFNIDGTVVAQGGTESTGPVSTSNIVTTDNINSLTTGQPGKYYYDSSTQLYHTWDTETSRFKEFDIIGYRQQQESIKFKNAWLSATTGRKNTALSNTFGSGFINTTGQKVSLQQLKDGNWASFGLDNSFLDDDGQLDYLYALQDEAEKGKIPEGSIVSFNYGAINKAGLFTSDYNLKSFIYINGEFVPVSNDVQKYNALAIGNMYVPEGYEVALKPEVNAKLSAFNTAVSTAIKDAMKDLTPEQQSQMVSGIQNLSDEEMLANGFTPEEINRIRTGGDSYLEEIVGGVGLVGGAVLMTKLGLASLTIPGVGLFVGGALLIGAAFAGIASLFTQDAEPFNIVKSGSTPEENKVILNKTDLKKYGTAFMLAELKKQ